ncbi:hypothetical protein KUF54_14005 [Comamonas sp. Y33R10-2]|uniref:hypothetical protein n=1 Tax=Comamonas sp. Y33R10-2 TaxID=2853257 RepID=UPI001C5CAFE3|nr:hypothetical protein [Comamonas sp. Y33R10-2]QXZ09126.1 hypothetical protein KUF54_14005 [Comamonas sp. Y33R10-2]
MNARAQLFSFIALGVALLLAVLSMVCWQFSQINTRNLTQERNHFLLQSLRKTAEDFLATGMTPEQMPAMQDIIDRERANFAQIMAIDIFNPAGRISYSTDAGALHTQVPQDWVSQLVQSGSWETQDPTQDQLGMRFENDLGRAAGGIVLTLQPTGGAWTLAQWQGAGVQALIWVGLFIGCCAAALALLQWELLRCLRPYRQISRILAQEQVHETDSGSAGELKPWAAQAAKQLEQEYTQTQQAMQQLQELDRGQ